MTEQEIAAPTAESAPPSASEQKPSLKSEAQKKTPKAPPKKSTQKSSSLTDEEKREARNAALREWRKKNKEKYTAYMAEWRAKRKGEQPASDSPSTGVAAAKQNLPRSAAKKPASKKPKKGGKA